MKFQLGGHSNWNVGILEQWNDGHRIMGLWFYHKIHFGKKIKVWIACSQKDQYSIIPTFHYSSPKTNYEALENLDFQWV